jgi:hypothetical protein
VSPAEDAAATEENAALVRRFVPEAVRDAGIGTLIAQRSCGTIDRPERGPLNLSWNRAGYAGLWAG